MCSSIILVGCSEKEGTRKDQEKSEDVEHCETTFWAWKPIDEEKIEFHQTFENTELVAPPTRFTNYHTVSIFKMHWTNSIRVSKLGQNS